MMPFSFRKALNDDAAVVCSIISQNQAIMHDEGRTQWQDGYPNKETIAADIAAGIGLVLVDAGKVIGYCVLITTGEPHYDTIEGKWLTQSNSHDCRYAVVHRLAVNPSLAGRGIATQWLSLLIDEAAETRMREYEDRYQFRQCADVENSAQAWFYSLRHCHVVGRFKDSF
jgi:GNAT superfamily N-acetyltransferase